MATKRPRLPTIACPHCGSRAEVRTSEGISPIYRELRLRCLDDECGHQFVAAYSVLRTVVQSARPDPAVVLPFSARMKPVAANDGLRAATPTPANDGAARELG